MNGTLPRRIATAVVLIIASLASLATSQALPDTTGSLEISVTLTSSEPAVARLIDVVVSRGDTPVDQPRLEVWEEGDYYGTGGISFSVIPRDPTEPVRPATPRFADSFEVVSQDLSLHCADGCSRSYIILVRRDPREIFDVGAVVNIKAFAYPTPNASANAKPPTATVRLSDEQLSNGVRSLDSAVGGSLDSDLFGSGSWRGTIHIPAAAYDALSGPVYGSISVTGSVEVTDYGGADIRLSVNGASETALSAGAATDRFSFERGWLSACTPGADCSVPVELALLWNPKSFFGLVPFVPGNAHATYRIEARLEYLDRAELPPGATIELTPQ